jgi:hypothetical protein
MTRDTAASRTTIFPDYSDWRMKCEIRLPSLLNAGGLPPCESIGAQHQTAHRKRQPQKRPDELGSCYLTDSDTILRTGE